MDLFLFLISLFLFFGLVCLLYWGYWNARKLGQQLLTTSTYKREEIIQAPQGSTIMEGQLVQIPGQYVQPIYQQQNQSQE